MPVQGVILSKSEAELIQLVFLESLRRIKELERRNEQLMGVIERASRYDRQVRVEGDWVQHGGEIGELGGIVLVQHNQEDKENG